MQQNEKTTGENAISITQSEPTKWYNKPPLLWLSLLFWPLFIYGMYKTTLYNPMLKKIVGSITFIILFFIGKANESNNNYDGGSSSSVNSYEAPSWQSRWDFSVPSIKRYIKTNIADPGSYESVEWDKASRNKDGSYTVLHTFSAKNGYGGRVRRSMSFVVSSDGQTVLRAQ